MSGVSRGLSAYPKGSRFFNSGLFHKAMPFDNIVRRGSGTMVETAWMLVFWLFVKNRFELKVELGFLR